MPFGSFGVHIFSYYILNVNDDHEAFSDSGEKNGPLRRSYSEK